MQERRTGPGGTEPKAADECRLEVAVLLEGRTHTAGIGWRISVEGRPGPARAKTRRRASSLLSCELAAVRRGLTEAAPLPCARLRLCVPDHRAVVLLQGGHFPRFRRAEATVVRLRSLLERFSSVQYESEFARDPELAHVVAEALDAGLHAAAEKEEHRVWVMERIVERAREVVLERTETGWVANGRYRVQLDPMRCDCPAWAARWARAPIGARRAQRLPCKHIVALAMHEGITVPADLAEMARKAF